MTGPRPGTARAVVRSYGGDRVACDRAAPRALDELVAAVQRAGAARRCMTFRGRGFAVDTQSLNSDLIIDVGELGGLAVAGDGATITVGPGVSCGELVRAALAHRRWFATPVSISDASVAGLVAANAVSRFTPQRGQVGDHVRELVLVTATGEVVRCSRDRDPALLRAAIGGLGYLGCIAEVTIALDPGADTEVETRVAASGRIDDVIAACVPPFADGSTRFGVLMPGLERGVVYASRRVTGERLRRFRFAHEPRSLLRLAGEVALRTQLGARLVWWLDERTRRARYVDPVLDFTFFMDANTRLHRLGRRLGFAMRCAQQSYLVPVATAAALIDHARARFAGLGLVPALSDVLYVPRSTMLLASSFELDGVLVSFGFETSRRSRLRRVRSALTELATRCRELGGRVHLVKNVHASADDLAAMYGHALPAFAAWKRRLDPHRLIRNAFLERVFPSLA